MQSATDFASLPAMVARLAATHAGETIMRRKDRGIWKAVTWAEMSDQVRQIGIALLAAKLTAGDTVAIISETRMEAAYADLAIQGAGAAGIVIHPEDSAERIRHILHSGGCRLAFVEGEEQLDKVLTVRAECPALSRIVIFDMKGLREFADPACVSLEAFTGGDLVPADWDASVGAVSAEQPAIILYPRDDTISAGRAVSHREVLRMVAAAADRLAPRPHDERLAVLRMSDVTERIWGLYLALATRCVSNYLESPETAVENLQELQPTVLGADAEAWGHLHARATRASKAATRAQRKAYDWALQVGRGGGGGAALAGVFVLNAVRRELGLNKVRLAYVAGTPIGSATLDWARCLGIAIQRIDEPAASDGQPDAQHQPVMRKAHA